MWRLQRRLLRAAFFSTRRLKQQTVVVYCVMTVLLMVMMVVIAAPLLLHSHMFMDTKPPSLLHQSDTSNMYMITGPPCGKSYLGSGPPPGLVHHGRWDLPEGRTGGEEDHKDWRKKCRHIPPPRGLCSLLQDLFYTKQPQRCDQRQHTTTFCTLDSNYIKCETPAVCITNNFSFYVGAFNFSLGRLVWHAAASITAPTVVIAAALEETVHRHLHSSDDGVGFVVIRCSRVDPTKDRFHHTNNTNQSHQIHKADQIEQSLQTGDYFSSDDNSQATLKTAKDETYQQLFMKVTEPAPPGLGHVNKHKFVTNYETINVNMIMIDSVSRSNFYRSLPKTVSFLDDLYDRGKTTVLDFQFMQSIKHRTYENLQALFSGYVNLTETPFGTYDIPSKPLSIHNLLKRFKSKGYKSLWLEDLCWRWEWGLVKDLAVFNEYMSKEQLWPAFKHALSEQFIDSIGVTLASCFILNSDNKKDPFHAESNVCFNGRNHHEYLLEYLQMYQMLSHDNRQPIITFTEINIAHEDTGLLIQNLDTDLREYLKFAASKLPNTLTMIFADHGSTYGNFIQSTPEAYIEIYNPFMFMLIPDHVSDKIGLQQMQVLKKNTGRLVTLLDFHTTLLTLIKETPTSKDYEFTEKYILPGGLFNNIPDYRKCSDLPLLQPNLCICQNFELSSRASVFHHALAEFGLGVLNNVVLSQRRKASSSSFDRCLPLRGVAVRRVVEARFTADLIQYKLDVVVRTPLHEAEPRIGTHHREFLSYDQHKIPKESEDHQQLFLLVVELGPTDPPLRLVSYERMTRYDSFKSCCDEGVELKLCVCDSGDTKYPESLGTSSIFPNLLTSFQSHSTETKRIMNLITSFASTPSFGVTPTIDSQYPKPNSCAYVLQFMFKSGVVLYGLNLCDYFVNVELTMLSKNVYSTLDRRKSVVGLEPMDLKLLVSGVVDNPRIRWHWMHRVWFTRL